MSQDLGKTDWYRSSFCCWPKEDGQSDSVCHRDLEWRVFIVNWATVGVLKKCNVLSRFIKSRNRRVWRLIIQQYAQWVNDWLSLPCLSTLGSAGLSSRLLLLFSSRLWDRTGSAIRNNGQWKHGCLNGQQLKVYMCDHQYIKTKYIYNHSML